MVTMIYSKIPSPFDAPQISKGGAGSGNHGHQGRPGERGGSAPGEEAPASAADSVKSIGAAEYHQNFEKTFEHSDFKSFVTHYSPDELAHMKATVTTADGKAGFAVKDHGDGRVEVTALYNSSTEKGLGSKLLQMAVQKYGVNYLECFGPNLPEIYKRAGFVVENQYPFDKDQAPKDWNYAKFGTPDYFTMRYKG